MKIHNSESNVSKQLLWYGESFFNPYFRLDRFNVIQDIFIETFDRYLPKIKMYSISKIFLYEKFKKSLEL